MSRCRASSCTTRGIQCLRDPIRAAVILHRLKDLDTTVSLACLREEVLEAMRWDARWLEFPMGVDR